MVTSSAYVGDCTHEKGINVQTAKMSGSNQQKGENEGFASNNVCVFDFNSRLATSKEHLFLFFCMNVLMHESS